MHTGDIGSTHLADPIRIAAKRMKPQRADTIRAWLVKDIQVWPQQQVYADSVQFPADELASRLLDEAGVAVLAGSAFGEVGRDNLRVSYANSRENLSAALERMGAFLAELP